MNANTNAEMCIDCGTPDNLLWEQINGKTTDNMICEPCADKRIDAGTWDALPNDCPECSRSFGPHYTGACGHGNGEVCT